MPPVSSHLALNLCVVGGQEWEGCRWKTGVDGNRSLCVVDEFGKGTLAADGIGLLCAVLQHFARQQPPPKVVACTHFSEIFQQDYLPRQALSSFFEAQVHQCSQTLPTYHGYVQVPSACLPDHEHPGGGP